MIGQRIKDSRLALGYSAEQVAAFLHVSPATVYRYENGDISKLPAKFIKPLAEYLCITPAYLMGWDGSSSDLNEQTVEFLPVNPQLFAEDPNESRLIKAYRGAEDYAKKIALETLENNQKKTDTDIGQMA